MTTLAKQLQRLVVPHTQAVLGGDTRKTSLLFNPIDAAALDKETYFALGINGLEELENIDAGFEEFHHSLFSESSQTFERSVQSKEVNKKLDKTISKFLLKLSPYFLLRPAHKALEWLIYRYHIQFYNVDDLVMCILPYHESKIFVRAMQVINLTSHTASKWDWLLPLQKSGVHLSRITLVNHCRTNSAFLAFICNMVPKFIEAHTDVNEIYENQLRVMFSFYATTVLGILESGMVTEHLVSSLFESLVRGLKSKIVDYKASSYMILGQLVKKIQLKTDLLETLVNIICKYMTPSLQTEAVTCLLLLYQKQDIKKLRKKAFKYLSRQPSLATILSRLSKSYMTHSLVMPIMTRLVPGAFKQAAINVVSSDSSDNDDDLPAPQLMRLLQDLLMLLPLEESTALFVASEVLEQYLSYFFNHDVEDTECLVQIVKGVIKQLEGRYSSSVDTAVENVLESCVEKEQKAAIMSFLNVSALSTQHHVIPTNEKSLVLSLNHPRPSVRRSAVEFMMKNRNQLEDVSFLSESVLARLRDDDFSVMSAIMQNCDPESLWEIVADKTELHNCLLKLLTRCDGMETGFKRTLTTATVKTLCVDSNVSLRLVMSYLPFITGSRTELEVCRTILKSCKSDIIQEISEDCLRILPRKMETGQKLGDEFVQFNMYVCEMLAKCLLTKQNSEIQKIVEGLCESEVDIGSKRELVLFEVLLVSIYYMIEKTSDAVRAAELSWIQASLLSLIQNKKFLSESRTKTRVSSLKKVVFFMSRQIRRDTSKITSPCFLFFIEHIVMTTSIPASLQKAVFWQYGQSMELSDGWLKMVVSMFGLVADLAVTSSIVHQQARNLIGVFLKHLFSDTRQLMKFLCLLWTRHANEQSRSFNLTPTLQMVALKLGLATFQKLDQKEADTILQTAAPVVVSLLIVCTSEHQAVREAAVECLKSLVSGASNSAPFKHLVNRVIHCQQEIISDSSFVRQVIVTAFSQCSTVIETSIKSPKRQRRKSHRQSSATTTLSSFLNIAIDDSSPDFVTQAVIGLTTALNTNECFSQLLPLLEYYSEKLSSKELTLSESDSLEMLLLRFSPDITGCLQENSLALKMLTWAMKCRLKLHHDKRTVQEIIIPLVTPTFYDSLPSAECRQIVLSSLFDVKIQTDRADVAATVKKVIKHLTLEASHVILELKPVLQMTSAGTVRETKRKRQSVIEEKTTEFASAAWQRVVVVLEAVQDKKKLDNADILVPVCFQVMSRVLDIDDHIDAEYTKQLLLTTVYNICNRLYSDQADVKIASDQFNMELIVQCIRTSDNPQTHHQALLLLTVAAHICPELLLHNIMSVFTFMGTNILRQDDSYSFHVISRILETVIPALTLACEERAAISPDDCNSSEVVMTTVLRVFAAALPHIPEHRKVVIFTKVISIVGEKRFLWRLLLLVLEQSITSFIDKPDEENIPIDKKEGGPVSDKTLSFLTNLATSFPPAIQLLTAKGAIAYISSLPVDKPSNTILRLRTMPKQLGVLNREEAEIFSFAFHTAKQMRHFKYSVVHMFVHLFSDPEFTAQVATAKDSSLMKNFQRFLGELLQYIGVTTKMADRNQDNPTSKFWKALLHKTYELLDKVVSLLPDTIFLNVVTGLMDHDLPTVQCKAMELLTNKVQHMKNVTSEIQVELLPLVDKLMLVIKTMVRHAKTGEETTKTGTVALYTLNVLCRLLGESNPQLFIKVLNQSTKVLTSCKDNASVLACALLCIAEICSSLKVHVIQHLSTFMPKVLKIMNTEDLIRNELLQQGAVTAIHRIVESLPHFISPYLLQITQQVCCNLSPESGVPQKIQVQQRIKAIRHTLATVIPTRVLLPTIIACYEDAAENTQKSIPGILSLLEEHITVMNREDLSSFYNQLLTFFFTALAFREQHTEAKSSLVILIEGAVINTLITMVMKMSEASFRPMLFKIFDWATRQDGSKDRVLVFYQLADSLAGKLKSLFTLFAGHIIKHAAQTLDDNNISKTDIKYFGSGKVARHKSCQLLNCILDCLYKCFLHDSEGFVNKERFDSLMQHIVDQIENTHHRFEERISQHLVPCIAQFAVAAQDDSLWRSLNYQILLKTRSQSPQVRLAALDVIDEFNKKLGEDFMSLLPETIPFLAELMEDDNEDVERRCQAVIADMEKTLGEPLQKYF